MCQRQFLARLQAASTERATTNHARGVSFVLHFGGKKVWDQLERLNASLAAEYEKFNNKQIN